ncbi:MAG: LbtU family siderophore porin [Coxiellaceae bacterium]|nr:LbtU family siderophore porin [Coxiellaceae bacterium]
MKLKALIAAVVGASVAGIAVAGGADHHKHHKPRPPVNPMMAGVVQGNSVWPSNMLKLLNGRLTVGGMANLDAYWANNTNYTLVPQFSTNVGAGGNSSSIYINNANVFVGGDMGFAHARLNLGYFDRLNVTGPAANTVSRLNNFTLDEGYMSLYDASSLPLYLKAGKFYDSVGSYNPYQLIPDLTNLMTQMGATGVEVGAVLPMGLYGNVTGFSNSSTAYNGILPTTNSHINNFSAKIGYGATNKGVHWGADLGFISNMQGLTYLNSNDFTTNVVGGVPTFSSNPSLIAADGFFKVDDFDFVGKYARVNGDNLLLTNPQDTTANFAVNNPWALVLGGGYSFHTANHPSHVGVGYQMTRHASYLFMPKNRYLADYNVGLNKYLSFQVAYYYDQNYGYTAPSAARIAAGDRNYATTMVDNNNTVAARLSVVL